jgi:hypothetical protein
MKSEPKTGLFYRGKECIERRPYGTPAVFLGAFSQR